MKLTMDIVSERSHVTENSTIFVIPKQIFIISYIHVVSYRAFTIHVIQPWHSILLGGDNVSMLTHAYSHKPVRKINP